jgi:hypothetical protein
VTHRLDDGFSTIFSFSLHSTTYLYEKEIMPPGYEGGGPIDTTTMRNSVWRTRSPKSLKTVSRMTASCAYNPAAYESILAMLQINQQVTCHFPDGSTLTFWGWLDDFKPGTNKEGEMPVAEVIIEPSNQTGDTEEAPVFVGAPSST